MICTFGRSLRLLSLDTEHVLPANDRKSRNCASIHRHPRSFTTAWLYDLQWWINVRRTRNGRSKASSNLCKNARSQPRLQIGRGTGNVTDSSVLYEKSVYHPEGVMPDFLVNIRDAQGPRQGSDDGRGYLCLLYLRSAARLARTSFIPSTRPVTCHHRKGERGIWRQKRPAKLPVVHR